MTPIDPTDVEALLSAYCSELPEFEVKGAYAGGLLAVARAVLPEGYVAVPVGDEEMIPVNRVKSAIGNLQDQIEYTGSGFPPGTNMASFDGALKACDRIWKELFPATESEAPR